MSTQLITSIVGYLAAFVGTFLMMPQVIRAIRTRHMKDVSGLMIAAYILNCTLWDIYGILLAAPPLIVCNSVALIIAIIQAILKKKYG